MFEQHPDFECIDDNDKLWRYKDLPRYLDLLLRSKLFFNRIDKFEDPFEGAYNTRRPIAADPEGMAATINTWHLNEQENYAMWNIYARGNYGLAIQTTFGRLKQAFSQTPQSIYIGKVEYYDEPVNENLPPGSCIPFLRKRNIYRYENEVRCCYLVTPQNRDSAFLWEEQGIYNGVFVKVLPEVLIERIYISPYSPPWFRELIVLLNQRCRIEAEVVHSCVFSNEGPE